MQWLLLNWIAQSQHNLLPLLHQDLRGPADAGFLQDLTEKGRKIEESKVSHCPRPLLRERYQGHRSSRQIRPAHKPQET